MAAVASVNVGVAPAAEPMLTQTSNRAVSSISHATSRHVLSELLGATPALLPTRTMPTQPAPRYTMLAGVKRCMCRACQALKKKMLAGCSAIAAVFRPRHNHHQHAHSELRLTRESTRSCDITSHRSCLSRVSQWHSDTAAHPDIHSEPELSRMASPASSDEPDASEDADDADQETEPSIPHTADIPHQESDTMTFLATLNMLLYATMHDDMDAPANSTIDVDMPVMELPEIDASTDADTNADTNADMNTNATVNTDMQLMSTPASRRRLWKQAPARRPVIAATKLVSMATVFQSNVRQSIAAVQTSLHADRPSVLSCLFNWFASAVCNAIIESQLQW
ncbi:hypothetical protein BC831DRAFT_550167 [Entophlyctis helioformis]|nr:hypothetical protein BC831DRAFT_550167 [Entophlyctis helioformis]